MKSKLNFLKGVLLSSFLILVFTLNINENIFSKVFSDLGKLNQEASVISSTKPNNIYNISPSKEIPGMYNFDYAFDKVTTKLKKGEKLFDLPIAQFDDELARKILEKEYGLTNVDFGPIRDAWNYPVKPNAFMKGYKKDENKKQSFLDNLKPNKALASDVDTNNPAIYNCRANTSVTGYFKAYFEDVELDNNIGYADPVYGEGRRQEACQVLQDIGEMLMLDTTEVTPDINFMRSDTPMPPNALAGASSYSGYYSTNPDNGSLHKHIISRQDPTPGTGDFDALIITNFTGNTQWDVDSNLNSSTYDMYSVLYHEVLHTLGFRGFLPAVIPETNVPTIFNTFSSFSYQDNTLQNRFITAITNLLNVPIGAPSPWFTTNQVVYQGVKNIVGATPDAIKPVYSPLNWQQGSSLSHFDMDRAPGETFVMHPSIGTNTERQIDDDEKDVLCHLGYMVEGECEDPTPVAVDDLVVLDGTETVCIDLLMNDTGNGAGYLRLNTLEFTSIQLGDLIEYFTGLNCGGSTQSNPFEASSIRLTPTNNSAVRVFTYTNKNIYMDSNRISFPARVITTPSCESITDPEEYVCNGDFSVAIPYMNLNFGFSQIFCDPLWENAPGGDFVLNVCNLYGTPDVIHTDLTSGFSSITSPAPANTDFPYLRYCCLESAVMKLKEPVIPGQEYVLSFRYAINNPTLNLNMKFLLLDDSPEIDNINTSGDLIFLDQNQIVYDENITNSNPWVWIEVEQNFTADSPYESLVFFKRDTAYNIALGQCCWSAFDNISIRRADAPPPPPTPTGKITGTTYQDLNQNGSYQSTEQKLPNLQVGLFQTGNPTPIQTTTTQDLPNQGKYTFSNLVDGTYYVALMGESLYPQVTQPGVSTDPFPTYNHMYEVTLADGQIVEDRDFGVTLNGDIGPVLGCTDPLAINYNPSANTDDGSCEYAIPGCTDKDAPNWNPNATLDDGSCEGEAIIKGIVYEDLNGNGNYDQNEPGISNAQVGLYIPDQSIPTQITSTDSSGYYSFINVFEGNKYVALINESTYSGISEPGVLNGLVLNHSHVYDIEVNTNTEVYYADFGVITNSQIADIGVRKTFADSQISLIDRFMTWRIDVTNYGPNNATNINISDVIPQGLTYAGHNLTAPNTYNSESGIINIPSLAVGQTTTITIRVKVPLSACGKKKNTASLLSLSQIDLNQLNNQSSSTKNLGSCARKIPGTTLSGVAG